MPSATTNVDLSSSKLALILNGAAGKKDGHARQEMIRDRLAPAFKAFRTYEVKKGGDIIATAKQATQDGAHVVVALGGDGTQSAVAGALAGTKVTMGVLPGGTFNYFARELGVGDTVERAIDTILAGNHRPVHLGELNGRTFLNNASFGVYPAILEQREAIYKRWGRTRIAAYWSVLLTLRDLRDPMHLTLTLDGKTQDYHTPLAFAARSAFQLESLGLEGADAVRAGQFAFFLAKGHTSRDLMKAAIRLAMGRMSSGQDFDLIIADEITVETRQKRRILAFDGEKARVNGPFRLRVHRDALSVFAPPVTQQAVDSPSKSP
jgi:diacylglycerol kinase family enzyme